MPVEVGLQTETGYPHKGHSTMPRRRSNPSTGTLAARAMFDNTDRALLPGYFVRVRVPVDDQPDALLVPDAALGSDQGGRYVLVVNKDDVVEQRKVEIGQDRRRCGSSTRASRPTTASSSPACCAPFPGRRSIRRSQAAANAK